MFSLLNIGFRLLVKKLELVRTKYVLNCLIDKGFFANIGYFSTVSLDKIDNIKSEYKVILRVVYGYNSYMVDIFEQKILSL